MPKLNQQRVLPYSAKAIFDLVLDIESYPDFLPWCSSAKITKKIAEDKLQAQLGIEFKGISEHYISDVSFGRISDGSSEISINEKNSEKKMVFSEVPEVYLIEAIAVKGPFKSLVNRWKISAIDCSTCQVDFALDFEFNSTLLGKLLGGIFSSASEKMMQAFENRAAQLSKNPS